MELDYDVVRYKNNNYAVICIKYKDMDLPTVIDYQDLRIIKKLKKNWRCNKNSFISCFHTYRNKSKEVFLHEIIMALKQNSINKTSKDISIVHINRIGLDNRRCNLIYDTINKYTNKNSKKKKRTINLPKNAEINPDEIPTYVWYMKPDDTHGERFMVDIGDIKWKTTSRKKLSLRYKLEEAKMFLRQLKESDPELFEDYSMNGDYTKDGKRLINDYHNIVHKAGYTYIKKKPIKNKTDQFLKLGKQNRMDRILLKQQGNLLTNSRRKRRSVCNLPPEAKITMDDIPQYCYYRPEYKARGGYFIVENHPNQNCKAWRSTSSKKVPFDEKYDQLVKYLRTIEKNNESGSESLTNSSTLDLGSYIYSNES